MLEIIIILLYHYNSYIYKNYNGRGVSKIMSSLQKFHRRTQVSMMVVAPILGSGSNTKGYYLGLAGDGTTFMYVAPKSTEVQRVWGSYNTQRGTTSTTNGLDNTNS